MMAHLSFITCPICQKPFAPKTGQKFCSLPCVHTSRRTQIPVTCKFCGTSFLAKPSTLNRGRGRYCSHLCHSAGRRISDIAAYLWSRVDTSAGPSACWPFKGHTKRYGKICFRGRIFSVHRLAYEMTYGPIPAGKILRHICDIKKCANPIHLITGTNSDNMQDAVERGQILKGEQNPKAKLTETKVHQAKEWAALGMKKCEIARRLQVHRGTIYRLLYNKSWKHLV